MHALTLIWILLLRHGEVVDETGQGLGRVMVLAPLLYMCGVAPRMLCGIMGSRN